MLGTTFRTLKAVRAWFTGRASVSEREIVLDRGDRQVPASVFLPSGGGRRLPGWVVLHGITRPGRFHPTLLGFCRALATSGAGVLVPQVPEWKNLRLAPEQTLPTIRCALDGLELLDETRDAPYGLIGFSFGSPQALRAAADDGIGPALGAVVGFGGYGSLERTLRFQLTGYHEWEGVEYRLRPDPYGRWIMGGNHLTAVHPDAGDVADALWRLAVEAGERRILAWDPTYDPLKEKLRASIDPARRELFDLFAPQSAMNPDQAAAEEIIGPLSEAALAASPELDPTPILGRVTPDVLLIHGRSDHLIPFTETLRLRAGFPAPESVDTTITALFAHSKQEGRLSSLRREARESTKLIRALRRMLAKI